MEADFLVLSHILLLQAASVQDLLCLIYVNAIHLLANLGFILLDQLTDVGNVEVIAISLCAGIHGECLLTAAAKVACDLQVAIGIFIGGDHLQEDSGGDTVASLAILLLQIYTNDMNGIPGADFDGTALNLLLDKEAATETCNVSIEEVNRCQSVVLVEVMMDISLENVIEL